jgi:hypothetical protein
MNILNAIQFKTVVTPVARPLPFFDCPRSNLDEPAISPGKA